MLTTFVAVATMTQTAPPKPAALVSKMLAYYHGSKTVTGQILFKQSANGQSKEGKTTLQIERPNKLYIRQDLQVMDMPPTVVVVSDGKNFSYSMPLSKAPDGRGRLYERIKQADRDFTVGDIYLTAGGSIVDRSAPLNFIIGRQRDLDFHRQQWASLEYQNTEKIDGKTAHLITGRWKESPADPVATGWFQMAITAEGELMRYATKQTVQVQNFDPVEITTTWTVKVTKDGKVDPKLFKVF
jgi:hypothetical protein